jgi:hypothetical protein
MNALPYFVTTVPIGDIVPLVNRMTPPTPQNCVGQQLCVDQNEMSHCLPNRVSPCKDCINWCRFGYECCGDPKSANFDGFHCCSNTREICCPDGKGRNGCAPVTGDCCPTGEGISGLGYCPAGRECCDGDPSGCCPKGQKCCQGQPGKQGARSTCCPIGNTCYWNKFGNAICCDSSMSFCTAGGCCGKSESGKPIGCCAGGDSCSGDTKCCKAKPADPNDPWAECTVM